MDRCSCEFGRRGSTCCCRGRGARQLQLDDGFLEFGDAVLQIRFPLDEFVRFGRLVLELLDEDVISGGA